MIKQYFDIGEPTYLNIVALTTAPELLKTLEVATKYLLTNEQRLQALAIIKQVQNDSQSTLFDVVNALSIVPSLEQFTLIIQKVFLLG